MDLSVVIPVYNNEETIRILVTNLSDILSEMHMDHEILCVNDASTDSSLTVLRDLESSFPQLVVLNQSINRGQHRSIIHGLQKSKGEYLVVMDADLQDDPNHLPRMIEEIQKDFDAVFLKRVGKYQRSSRMLTSRIYKGLIFFLTGLNPRFGSYFVFRSGLLDQVFSISCDPYISIVIAHFSKSIGFVEGLRKEREFGRSTMHSGTRIKMGLLGLRCAICLRTRH